MAEWGLGSGGKRSGSAAEVLGLATAFLLSLSHLLVKGKTEKRMSHFRVWAVMAQILL